MIRVVLLGNTPNPARRQILVSDSTKAGTDIRQKNNFQYTTKTKEAKKQRAKMLNLDKIVSEEMKAKRESELHMGKGSIR